jgi:hypothetical protein
LYVAIYLGPLIHSCPNFILPKDALSTEKVINYQSYKKCPRLTAVTANNLFKNCSCRCSVCLHLPMPCDLKMLFGMFWRAWCLGLPIQRYCNWLLGAGYCGVIFSSLSILCIRLVTWKRISGKDYFVWYRNPKVCVLVNNMYYTVTIKHNVIFKHYYTEANQI